MNTCPKILQLRLRGSTETPFQTYNCSSYLSKTQVDSIPQQTSASIWSCQNSQTGHSSEAYVSSTGSLAMPWLGISMRY
jgi:hypothetical protein